MVLGVIATIATGGLDLPTLAAAGGLVIGAVSSTSRESIGTVQMPEFVTVGGVSLRKLDSLFSFVLCIREVLLSHGCNSRIMVQYLCTTSEYTAIIAC